MTLSPQDYAVHSTALRRSREFRESEAELLTSIMEVDSLRVYEKLGYASMFQYCVKELGLTEDVTYNFIRVARAAREVSALKDAIDQGDLTVSKARRITPVLKDSNADAWIDKAKTSSKAELERDVAAALPEPEKKKRPRAKRVGGKKVDLSLRIDEETMQLLRRAQELESQSKRKFAELDVTLAEVLKFYIERKDPVAKAERAAERPPKKKSNLARAKFKRKPLSAAAEHAVNARDKRCCQHVLPNGEKCGSKMWIDIHHITPVSKGGTDSPENLITLCGQHHRQHHRAAG